MKCLLCDYENSNDEVVRNHYIKFYMIEKNNYFLNELFTPDSDNRY